MLLGTLQISELQMGNYNYNYNHNHDDDELLFLCLQFTRSGHTQLHLNAIMITSTISVVLFSTVVRHHLISL